jgi:hypothetical protein
MFDEIQENINAYQSSVLWYLKYDALFKNRQAM